VKIERVETLNLRFEYPQPFEYAGGVCNARVTTLVRVFTHDGRVGVGSAYTHPLLAYLVIQHQLAPLLIGHDPRDEQLWDKMYAVTRWYGRKGAAMSALGAVDIACWDLRGQDRGQPVWQLLGGANDRCPAYASALLWKTPEQLAFEAQSLLSRGFQRLKMRLGRGHDLDIACVEAVRKAIGAEADLMVDGSMRYNLESALILSRVLAEHRVLWFEEPFAPENLDDFVALRRESPVPLAAGENEFGFQGFRELIRAGAVDIVQPDASRCGGISELVRAARLAHASQLRVAPHSWSDAVAIVANAHVVAALPSNITVEIDQTGNPFVEELLLEPLQVKDGHLRLGHAPGLGVRLNDKVVDNYRLPDPLQLPDGCYSDMVFGAEYGRSLMQ
jgi:D-galactarolactone cycloisomerase